MLQNANPQDIAGIMEQLSNATQQAQQQWIDTSQTPTGNYKGGDYGYLQELLKGMIAGTDPAFNKMRQQGLAQIDQSVNKNITSTQENLASSGLGRSGVGVSALNQIYAGGNLAKSNLETNLSAEQMQMKQNQISQLLGLNQFGGSQALSELNSNRNFLLGQQGLQQQTWQTQQALDSQPGWFGQLLGSLIGAGGQIGAAAAMPTPTKP